VSLELLNARGELSHFRSVVLDFNGTLALDGKLLPGVLERLKKLKELASVYVLTADTFGTSEAALGPVGIEIRVIREGRDKASFVSELGRAETIVIGNGRNDLPMFKVAGLSIGILGPEGMAGELAGASSIVVAKIEDALDLLLNSKRVKATLRS